MNNDKLRNYLNNLDTKVLKGLLKQYTWELDNNLSNATEQITIINEIINNRN